MEVLSPAVTEQSPGTVLAPWQEKRAKNIMLAQMAKGVAIAQVARECALSRSHFSRAFKTATGCTPRDWLRQERINKAKALLCHRHMPIAEIGLECGFADQSHLTRIFTRIIGVSPSRWRAQQLSGS